MTSRTTTEHKHTHRTHTHTQATHRHSHAKRDAWTDPTWGGAMAGSAQACDTVATESQFARPGFRSASQSPHSAAFRNRRSRSRYSSDRRRSRPHLSTRSVAPPAPPCTSPHACRPTRQPDPSSSSRRHAFPHARRLPCAYPASSTPPSPRQFGRHKPLSKPHSSAASPV